MRMWLTNGMVVEPVEADDDVLAALNSGVDIQAETTEIHPEDRTKLFVLSGQIVAYRRSA